MADPDDELDDDQAEREFMERVPLHLIGGPPVPGVCNVNRGGGARTRAQHARFDSMEHEQKELSPREVEVILEDYQPEVIHLCEAAIAHLESGALNDEWTIEAVEPFRSAIETCDAFETAMRNPDLPADLLDAGLRFGAAIYDVEQEMNLAPIEGDIDPRADVALETCFRPEGADELIASYLPQLGYWIRAYPDEVEQQAALEVLLRS